jgi:type II secretory pathway predicted ATPase ExeA
MNHKLLSLFGLKWNPFSTDVPVEALWTTPKLDHFAWRMEHQVREGGFALITGDPGTGKSVAMRQLAHRLHGLTDVQLGVLTRPQSRIPDFYRELGQLFGVALSPHNRWGGFKLLRENWLTHIEATRFRPVLLIDEAQETPPDVLAELRILASTDFDSRSILTVILAGDARLTQRFQSPQLLPIASRIRVRLNLDFLEPHELQDWLHHALEQAGNPQLMTPELMTTLTEHAAGNLRILNNMANEMLVAAARQESTTLDQKLYHEVFAPQNHAATTRAKRVHA